MDCNIEFIEPLGFVKVCGIFWRITKIAKKIRHAETNAALPTKARHAYKHDNIRVTSKPCLRFMSQLHMILIPYPSFKSTEFEVTRRGLVWLASLERFRSLTLLPVEFGKNQSQKHVDVKMQMCETKCCNRRYSC